MPVSVKEYIPKHSFYELCKTKMQIYCSKRKKHTYNACPKTLVLISKNKIKGKSKCAIFLTERTFIDKIEDEYDLESKLEISFQLFTD